MDGLSVFLKTALYRAISVFVVGVLAVKMFSFLLFVNGNIGIFDLKNWCALYFVITFVLGEVLCFFGELLIGKLFFSWKIFDDSDEVERVSPLSNNFLRRSDFGKLTQYSMDFSEVNFVLSRVFAGLGLLAAMSAAVASVIILKINFAETLGFLALLFMCFCYLFICMIILWLLYHGPVSALFFLCNKAIFGLENIKKLENILFLLSFSLLNAVIVVIVVFFGEQNGLQLSSVNGVLLLSFLVLTVVFFYISIVYRTNANKNIKYYKQPPGRHCCRRKF